MKPAYLMLILFGVPGAAILGYAAASPPSQKHDLLAQTCNEVVGDPIHRLPPIIAAMNDMMPADLKNDDGLKYFVVQRCQVGGEQTMRQIAEDSITIRHADH